MLLLIRSFDGFVRSAFLLAVMGARLRVALPDCGDTAEIRLVGGEWLDESGEPVEIDFEPAQEEFERYARPVVKPGAVVDGPLGYSGVAQLANCLSYVN